jgi:hypothetical protein
MKLSSHVPDWARFASICAFAYPRAPRLVDIWQRRLPADVNGRRLRKDIRGKVSDVFGARLQVSEAHDHDNADFDRLSAERYPAPDTLGICDEDFDVSVGVRLWRFRHRPRRICRLVSCYL